mmetsp:Transcript_88152/g.273125  ORF Transcript_88152/g.273125 Transcript_88152/m.273125 type:complete len:202 (+) Transcript_88152:699-1304(+)
MAPTSTAPRSRVRHASSTRKSKTSGCLWPRTDVGTLVMQNPESNGCRGVGCAATPWIPARCPRASRPGRCPSLANGFSRNWLASGCPRALTWRGSMSGSMPSRHPSLKFEVSLTPSWMVCTTLWRRRAKGVIPRFFSISSARTSGCSWRTTSGGGSETLQPRRRRMKEGLCTAARLLPAPTPPRLAAGNCGTQGPGRSARP